MLSPRELSPVDSRSTPGVDPVAQARAAQRAKRLAGLERARLNQEAADARQQKLALRVAHLTADAGSEEDQVTARREAMTFPDVSPEHQRPLAGRKESMLREMQSRHAQPALGLHPLPAIDRRVITLPGSSPAITTESVLDRALSEVLLPLPSTHQGPTDGVRAPDPVRRERLMGDPVVQGLSLEQERERREEQEAIDLVMALVGSAEQNSPQRPPFVHLFLMLWLTQVKMI